MFVQVAGRSAGVVVGSPRPCCGPRMAGLGLAAVKWSAVAMCQPAMGSQISSATSMTRSGPGWAGSLGVRISPVHTQTASFSRR